MSSRTSRNKALSATTAAAVAVSGIVGGGLWLRTRGQWTPSLPVVKAFDNPHPAWPDGMAHFVVKVDAAKLAASVPVPGGARTDSSILTDSSTPDTASAPADSWDLARLTPVAPNPAHPIVWRPGQPMSVLSANMSAYPVGTMLEKDTDGNVRGVPPASSGRPAPAEPSSPTTTDPVARDLDSIPGVVAVSAIGHDYYQVTARKGTAASFLCLAPQRPVQGWTSAESDAYRTYVR